MCVEATDMSAKTDYDHGRKAGQENDVAALLANRKNDSYCLGYSVGRDEDLAQHKDTTSIIFESPGMTNFARRGKVGS